jgi:hypothetical protein
MISFRDQFSEIIGVDELDSHEELDKYLQEIESSLEQFRKANASIENRENKELRDIYNYDLIFKYIMEESNGDKTNP